VGSVASQTRERPREEKLNRANEEKGALRKEQKEEYYRVAKISSENEKRANALPRCA